MTLDEKAEFYEHLKLRVPAVRSGWCTSRGEGRRCSSASFKAPTTRPVFIACPTDQPITRREYAFQDNCQIGELFFQANEGEVGYHNWLISLNSRYRARFDHIRSLRFESVVAMSFLRRIGSRLFSRISRRTFLAPPQGGLSGR
jgi:hypothetical protein